MPKRIDTSHRPDDTLPVEVDRLIWKLRLLSAWTESLQSQGTAVRVSTDRTFAHDIRDDDG